MLKKLVLSGLAGAFAVATISGAGAARPERLEVCHQTGNAADPWVVISASQSAVDQHIMRHADDVIPEEGSREIYIPPA